MAVYSKLERLQELQEQVKTIYVEINQLKSEIVKEMVESDNKTIELDNNKQATLVWVVDKKIDYDKLIEHYPDIYRLGIRPQFSVQQALRSVSPKLLRSIIEDCTDITKQYKLKVGKKK